MPGDSFEHFYLRRVALSEACGCAEAVIRFRDIDEAAIRKSTVAFPSRRTRIVKRVIRMLRHANRG